MRSDVHVVLQSVCFHRFSPNGRGRYLDVLQPDGACSLEDKIQIEQIGDLPPLQTERNLHLRPIVRTGNLAI